MKRSKGASPATVAALVTAYFAGIITVAVICCDDVLLPGETGYATASPPSASSIDGGEQAPADLSSLAFVFEEGFDEIAGVTASVMDGLSEIPLDNVGLYKTSGVMVVVVQAQLNQNFRPRFYFLNREGKVVEEYWGNLFPDRSLITYAKQHFAAGYEQYPKHSQPEEIQATVGETAFVLQKKSRLWVDGQFVDMWQVVKLPADSQASATSNCILADTGQPSTVGIISDGTPGETVSLEVLP